MLETSQSDDESHDLGQKAPATQIIQRLIAQGYHVSRIFSPEQNSEFEAYIRGLKSKGVDCEFVIDRDLEGTGDFSTGKINSREIKVLER